MRRAIHSIGLVILVAAHVSCGNVVRDGRSPVMLVVNSMGAAPGGGRGANNFVGTLISDVQVLLTTPDPCTPATPCPTVYNDFGQVILSLAMKDTAVAPTSNNAVTLSRYHVEFIRADGRNTPGVDVPFGFDGGISGTIIPGGASTFSYELVRHTSKEEPPLVQLIRNAVIIHAIARVTYYGRDLVGNDVSVTGSISVDFGNFGDQ